MRLLGEWLVAKVVCILTIIKCFFINEKRIQEEEDGEKRGTDRREKRILSSTRRKTCKKCFRKVSI